MIEFKKITKILNEMVTFAIRRDATKIDSTIEKTEEQWKLIINAENVKCNSNCLDDLKQYLNVPRQRSTEEYYWELTGESDTGSELALVGMMVDKAIVNFDKGNLYIELYRLNLVGGN